MMVRTSKYRSRTSGTGERTAGPLVCVPQGLGESSRPHSALSPYVMLRSYAPSHPWQDRRHGSQDIRPFARSRRPMIVLLAALLTAVFVAPSQLAAQPVAEAELGTPMAVLNDGLKSVTALRELADGRVLVVDSVGQKLLVVDLSTGKSETRMSGGTDADEFRTLGNLWAWAGDSVAVADVGQAQLHILSPDGTKVRSVRLNLGAASRSARPAAQSTSLQPSRSLFPILRLSLIKRSRST